MRRTPGNSHLPAAWSRAVPLWLRAGQGHLGSQHPLGLWHGLGSRGQKPGGPRGGGPSWGSASGSQLQTQLSLAPQEAGDPRQAWASIPQHPRAES